MSTKKTKSKSTKETEVIIKVQQETLPSIKEDDLLPQKDGGKYRVVSSWLTENQVMRMVQKTPPQYILNRKGRGGMRFDYVPVWYFKKALNFSFGWNWDYRIIKQEIIGKIGDDGTQVITLGQLTVKDDKGHAIVKEDNGKAEIKYLRNSKIPMDIGNDFKASASDALKRCCVQLGMASDVYGRHEMKEEGIVIPKENSQIPTINEPRPLKEGQVAGPDGHPIYLCSACDAPISEAEYGYSKRLYKKALCRECQKQVKK